MKLDFSFLLEEVPTGESLKYIDWIVSGLQNTFYIFIIGFILSFGIGTILGILAVRESKIKMIPSAKTAASACCQVYPIPRTTV